MYNLLDIVQGDGSYVAGQLQSQGNYYFNNFGEAVIYALIGFGVVVLGIALIIYIIWLVGLLMRKTNNLEFLTKKREKKPVQPAAKPAEKVAENSDEIPDEVKAAIVAAIMAYYQQEEGKCEFTVRRIKRI
ncbi:MAG: OadG family protein [Candidatus Coproplasma sp.]